jgi:hypothetical protein
VASRWLRSEQTDRLMALIAVGLGD